MSYCTYDTGYAEGLDGSEYLRVCPRSLEGDFLAGYELGASIHDLRSELHVAEANIEKIHEALAQLGVDDTGA